MSTFACSTDLEHSEVQTLVDFGYSGNQPLFEEAIGNLARKLFFKKLIKEAKLCDSEGELKDKKRQASIEALEQKIRSFLDLKGDVPKFEQIKRQIGLSGPLKNNRQWVMCYIGKLILEAIPPKENNPDALLVIFDRETILQELNQTPPLPVKSQSILNKIRTLVNEAKGNVISAQQLIDAKLTPDRYLLSPHRSAQYSKWLRSLLYCKS